MERTEWIDALGALETRIMTLERQQRNQASHIADHASNLDRFAGKLQEHEDTMNKEHVEMVEIDRKVRPMANRIENEYVKLDRRQAHEAQIQSFSNEVQTMMTVCADLNGRYIELSSRQAPCPGPAPNPTCARNFQHCRWRHMSVAAHSS